MWKTLEFPACILTPDWFVSLVIVKYLTFSYPFYTDDQGIQTETTNDHECSFTTCRQIIVADNA